MNAEALAMIQRLRTRQIPPVFNRRYIFTNPECFQTPVGSGNARVRRQNADSQRKIIFWRYYEKGHMVTHFPLDYETIGEEVICNYEQITFEEMGQAPLIALFSLNSLLQRKMQSLVVLSNWSIHFQCRKCVNRTGAHSTVNDST